MNIIKKSIIINFLNWCIYACLFAQTPMLINYQGKLSGPLVLADTTLTINFFIYDANEGGNEKWQQQIPNVEVKQGVFNVLLGGTAAPFESNVFDTGGGERWLEVQIDGQSAFYPRFRLVSVPYAITAQSARTLSAADGDPANAVFVDSVGNVGIGTMNPATKLDIEGGNLDMSGNAITNVGSIKITDTWQAVGITDIQTDSTSWGDMPDMSISFTLSKTADVFIEWDATLAAHGVASSHPYGKFRLVLDGTQVNSGHFQQFSADDMPCSLGWIAQDLTAGSHIAKVQWALGAAGYYIGNRATTSIMSRQLRIIAFYH